MSLYRTGDRLSYITTLKDSNDVEAVLQVLDGLGVALRRIRTGGEHSSHDGTYSFEQEYATYAEFAANAHRDFAAETERYKSAAEVDWSHTHFELAQPTDWNIHLFMRKKEEQHDLPNVAYLSIDKKEATDEDKTRLDRLLASMDAYLEK